MKKNRPFLDILYEDSDIIAVNKPAGILCFAGEGIRKKNMYDIVTMHIQKKNPKGRAAMVHRLDGASEFCVAGV